VIRIRLLQSLLLIVMLAASTAVLAQGPSPYVAWGDAHIAQIRREMRENMSQADAQLEKSIIYRVVDTGELNAVAIPSTVNGKREIRIASGLLEVIDDVVTLETVSVLWNKTDCVGNYLNYIQELVASNDVLILGGVGGNPLMKPFPYMHSKPSICPQVSPDVITNNVRQADSVRSAAILESIKWVLLHEFAHHLHGDVHSSDTKMDRKQERNADAYASISMMHPPESPVQAAVVVLLFFSLEGFTANNPAGDHPSSVQRLKDMLDFTRSSPQFAKTLDEATPAQRTQIEASLDQLDQMAADAPAE
jgi:hypothetical protein